jgi:hypothetical protein
MYCNIKIHISDVGNVDGLIPEIKRQMLLKASKESMSEMMNSTVNLVRRLKFIPLFIKRPVALLVYGFWEIRFSLPPFPI